jgi:histidinol dehydrogenase
MLITTDRAFGESVAAEVEAQATLSRAAIAKSWDDFGVIIIPKICRSGFLANSSSGTP